MPMAMLNSTQTILNSHGIPEYASYPVLKREKRNQSSYVSIAGQKEKVTLSSAHKESSRPKLTFSFPSVLHCRYNGMNEQVDIQQEERPICQVNKPFDMIFLPGRRPDKNGKKKINIQRNLCNLFSNPDTTSLQSAWVTEQTRARNVSKMFYLSTKTPLSTIQTRKKMLQSTLHKT